MIPYLTSMTQQQPDSESTLSSVTPTTTSTMTWETPSTHSEHLPSTTTTATATTTTTTTAAATETTDSALKVLLTSWTSSLKNRLENMTEVPATGGDVAVDVGGRGGGLHTPLNAPQPSLESVTLPPSSFSSFGRSADLSELGWIIPISVISLVLMVALALALYYGVRKLELRMLSWCYRNCGCCCAPGGGRGGRVLRGEQYDTLSEETGRKETVRLRDFREGSPSYGMTRKMSKEYSPPPRQPSPSFDDGDS